MVESTIDINFYKKALLEELIEEIEGLQPIGWRITWAETCAYNKVIQLLEDRLKAIKEDTDE